MNEGDSSNSVVDDRSKMEDEFIPDGYAKLPVNKIVGLKLEELEMAIFMSKESVYAAELTNFQVTRIVYVIMLLSTLSLYCFKCALISLLLWCILCKCYLNF